MLEEIQVVVTMIYTPSPQKRYDSMERADAPGAPFHRDFVDEKSSPPEHARIHS